MIIREEQERDIEPIARVTEAAFSGREYSSGTEPFIIRGLRAAGALTLSLVAEQDGEIIGHVAFSPVTISDGGSDWYGLGPLSVSPEHQNRGIGQALVREGLSSLKAMGAKGCVLLGDPNYYKRFGFASIPGLVLADFPPEYFMALPFDNSTPSGTVLYHAAFSAEG